MAPKCSQVLVKPVPINLTIQNGEPQSNKKHISSHEETDQLAPVLLVYNSTYQKKYSKCSVFIIQAVVDITVLPLELSVPMQFTIHYSKIGERLSRNGRISKTR